MLERVEPSDLVVAFLALCTPSGEGAPGWPSDDLVYVVVEEMDGDMAIILWSLGVEPELDGCNLGDQSEDRRRRVRVSRLREVMDATPVVTSRRSRPITVGATFLVTPLDLERLLDN